MAPNTPIHYFEYYPHHMGTIRREVTFTFEQLGKLHTFAVNPDKHDEFNELETALTTESGPVYALHEALTGDKKEDRFAKILAKLEKGKAFGDFWEEGSFAFSSVSMEKAIKKVRKLEQEAFELDY